MLPTIYKAALDTLVICCASTNLRVSNGLRSLDANLGRIFCRASTNDGSSWAGDIDIGTSRALLGLSRIVGDRGFELSRAAVVTRDQVSPRIQSPRPRRQVTRLAHV
jgi:hypothetical protein